MRNAECKRGEDGSRNHPSPPTILLLGDSNRAEFAETLTDLNRQATLHRFADVDAAVKSLRDGNIVADLIVIAQAYPGEFSQDSIDRLRRIAPLARIVGLMGSWCEGEMRTGTPWPGVVRTYWRQWTARADRQLSRMNSGESCSWTLPPTATEEERILAESHSFSRLNQPSEARPDDNGASGGRPGAPGLVLVTSPSIEMAEWLSAAIRSQGYATVWQRRPGSVRVEGASAAIYDGSDLGQAELDDLRQLVVAVQPTPVIALLGFPRIEDCRRAQSAGVATVVSKPVNLEDLLWEINQISHTTEYSSEKTACRSRR